MTMERLTLSSLAISCVTVIGSASKILSISHCQRRMTGHCAPLLQGSVSLANLLEPPLHCTFISSSAKRLFVLWLVFAALWPILNLNKKTAWICFLSNIIEVKWSEIKLLSPVRLCDPRDYSVHGILQARILEGCHSLLQGIFPTQGSNPSLPYCRWIPYQLSHKGSLISSL